MTRQVIYDALSKICTVGQLSNRTGTIKKDTIILRKKPSMPSVNSSVGVFIYWEVLCYVPDKSLVQLDNLVNKVISELKLLGVEVTNNFGEDYYDDDFKAYMSSVEFRVPKVIL